jgi:putative flippase GtrA
MLFTHTLPIFLSSTISTIRRKASDRKLRAKLKRASKFLLVSAFVIVKLAHIFTGPDWLPHLITFAITLVGSAIAKFLSRKIENRLLN